MDGLYLPRMVFPEYQDQIRSGVGKKIKVGFLFYSILESHGQIVICFLKQHDNNGQA